MDPGTVRCGLAVSDEGGRIATPLEPLLVADGARLAERIAERAASLGAVRILVGYPLNMDGTVGPRAQAVERFAARLQEVAGVPVELVDERLTSVEAARRMQEAQVAGRGTRKRRRTRGGLDSQAAAVLLQAWLDRKARGAE